VRHENTWQQHCAHNDLLMHWLVLLPLSRCMQHLLQRAWGAATWAVVGNDLRSWVLPASSISSPGISVNFASLTADASIFHVDAPLFCVVFDLLLSCRSSSGHFSNGSKFSEAFSNLPNTFRQSPPLASQASPQWKAASWLSS